MAACLNPETRARLGNLLNKLTIPQRQELLQQTTTGTSSAPANLIAYVTTNANKDTAAASDVGKWYKSANLEVDNGQIVSVVARQEIPEDTSGGFGIGGQPPDDISKTEVIRFAQGMAPLNIEKGGAMTETQINHFLEWCTQSTGIDNAGNLDIFLAVLGEDGPPRKVALNVLQKLYEYDNGVTMRDKFLCSANGDTYSYGDLDGYKFGIIEYAYNKCYSSATIKVLSGYYDHCKMAGDWQTVKARPNVGASLSGVWGTPRDCNAVTNVSISDDSRGSHSNRLRYQCGPESRTCQNLRQLAQFPNLQEVTIIAGTQYATEEDMKCLFLEAKNLKVFTIKPSCGDRHITVEMANRALEQAKAELVNRSDARELNIDIQAT
jgi:hypothetical protein